MKQNEKSILKALTKQKLETVNLLLSGFNAQQVADQLYGGKLLTIITRWKNTIDDSKSGPWSDEASARVNW